MKQFGGRPSQSFFQFQKILLTMFTFVFFLLYICVSFERKLCRGLAIGLAKQFEEKEEALRESTRKLDEKKRLQDEKMLKRTRDAVEKEKGKRSRNKLALNFTHL